MAEQFYVDLAELRMAGDHLEAAVADHATDTARHRDDFLDGVARWRGAASSSVLRAVAEQWETRHADHQQKINELREHLGDAVRSYTTTDDDAGQAIDAAAGEL